MRSGASESGIRRGPDDPRAAPRRAVRQRPGGATAMRPAPRPARQLRRHLPTLVAAPIVSFLRLRGLLAGRPPDQPEPRQHRNLEHHGEKEDWPEPGHDSSNFRPWGEPAHQRDRTRGAALVIQWVLGGGQGTRGGRGVGGRPRRGRGVLAAVRGVPGSSWGSGQAVTPMRSPGREGLRERPRVRHEVREVPSRGPRGPVTTLRPVGGIRAVRKLRGSKWSYGDHLEPRRALTVTKTPGTSHLRPSEGLDPEVRDALQLLWSPWRPQELQRDRDCWTTREEA